MSHRGNCHDNAVADSLLGRDVFGSVIVNEGRCRFFEPYPGRTWSIGLNATRDLGDRARR